jgi:predicted transcriptional regulator
MTTTTTTIRIDEELKTRVTAAAERTGKTAHAFILDAIAQTVEQVEQDDELHRVADERWAKVLAKGKTVPWDEAKAYLAARARGDRPARPAARKLAR